MDRDTGAILQAAYPKVVATLTRALGDMALAEDATQDAMLKAVRDWRRTGLPDEPVAWLVTVARNGAIDSLRKTQRQVPLEDDNVVHLPSVDEPVERQLEIAHLPDDLLRLIFTCCHPVLTEETQVLLTLKVVLGFSVEEIAASLLSSRQSVERRVSRAKQKLNSANVGFVVPAGDELAVRSEAVLRVVYLLFNHGYSRQNHPDVYREKLMDQAIRLCRIVARLFRDHSEAKALLALMLLISARSHGRMDAAGAYVPLMEQDRGQWDWTRIREGKAIIDALLAARVRPCAYQIQAAIAALHAVEAVEETDWTQIAGLYKHLATYDPSPVVPVNHAVAVAMAGDDLGALRLLQPLESDTRLQDYQPYFAALAFIHERLGAGAKAKDAYGRAIELCEAAPERQFLQRRMAALEPS